MRVLVACEYSGVVRDAFRARGHDAWSCDLLNGEGQTLGEWRPDLYPPKHQLAGRRFHYKADVRHILPGGRQWWTMALENQAPQWDLMIAHPPCTHLSVSGARHFDDKLDDQSTGLGFVLQLAAAKIPRIAIENPISILSSHWREPDQIIQPWQFGHGETKATCLWLKGLPKLVPTNIVEGREARVHKMPPGPDRWKERSKTFQGIADAMAEQWGSLTSSSANHQH